MLLTLEPFAINSHFDDDDDDGDDDDDDDDGDDDDDDGDDDDDDGDDDIRGIAVVTWEGERSGVQRK